MMHALHIPFTSLLVGGMAVIIICLIAEFSEHNYKAILKSAAIVLVVKAMSGPFTPVTAYIAVSFQALLGYALFSLLGVNFISIILLSTIAMLESAIQKLIVLTLFFGQSLWKAMNNILAFAGSQLGHIISNETYWVMAFCLFIYLLGGIFIALLSFTTISSFNAGRLAFILNETDVISTALIVETNAARKKHIENFCC
jgi:hypothetical protein